MQTVRTMDKNTTAAKPTRDKAKTHVKTRGRNSNMKEMPRKRMVREVTEIDTCFEKKQSNLLHDNDADADDDKDTHMSQKSLPHAIKSGTTQRQCWKRSSRCMQQPNDDEPMLPLEMSFEVQCGAGTCGKTCQAHMFVYGPWACVRNLPRSFEQHTQ